MSDHRIHEHLSEDEAELARRLRALPAGQPSGKIDAAILAASRAPAKRSARPTWVLMGTATAASVMLVLGLLSRYGPGARSALDGVPAPSAPAAMEETTSTQTAVAAEAVATPEASAQVAAKRQPAREAEPANALDRMAPPEASRSAEGAIAPMQKADREEQSADANAVGESVTPMALPAPPPAAAAPMPLRDEAELRARAGEPAEGEGKAAAIGDEPATADIEAIRTLLAAGRRDEAMQQLRELAARHPNWPVPDDLRDLLE